MLAGISIGINSIYDAVYEMCRDYLTEQPADFTVCISREDIEYERNKSAAEAKFEHRVYEDFSSDYLETLAVYRKIAIEMLKYDAFIMHGAAVALSGKAYLFTAPSGVGKTTHTGFWLKTYPSAFILNGDKPIIRIIGGKVFACGTPWAGKEGQNRNDMLPLKAVCFLARGKENLIDHISFDKVFPFFISQTYRPNDGEKMKKTLELVRFVGETTRMYTLFCNLNPDAARVAKEGMTEHD